MENEFIPHAEALELMELGFDEPCFAIYAQKDLMDEPILEIEHRSSQYSAKRGWENGILAPLFQQVFKWFSKTHGLHTCIMYSSDGIIKGGYTPMIDIIKPHKAILDFNEYNTQEDAELASIRGLIDLVKNKK